MIGGIQGLWSVKWHRAVTLLVFFVVGTVFPTLALGAYVDNGDGTISDTSTGLMWQKSDDGETRTWQEALDYAENLTYAGYRDWRLPTIDELRGLIVCTDGKIPEFYNFCGSGNFTSPTIDPVFECASAGYWSASEGEDHTNFAWPVYFNSGYVYWDLKGYHKYVRCVRSGPSGSFDPLSPLVISATADRQSGTVPLTVSFASTIDTGNPPYTYSWDFGDGNLRDQQNASHTYALSGTYTAKITVTDAEGQAASKEMTITVSEPEYVNQPPTASISSDIAEGPAPLTVRFTGSGSDPEGQAITSWLDFGDGTVLEGSAASHTYNNPGSYAVTFWVQDPEALRGSAQMTLTVTAPPQPVCDSTHLDLCYDQTSCVSTGGFWCNNACQSSDCPPPAPVCDSTHLDLCYDQVSCESAGAFWCNNACHNAACVVEPPSSGIGKAIIIAAGGAHKQNTLFPTTNEYCQLFFKYLKKRGYTDEDIIYMNPVAPITDAGVMDLDNQDYKLFSPESELESAFTEAAQDLSNGQQFVLYIHGHASVDLIKINNDYQLSSSELRRLLDKIPAGVQQIIIIDTCHSGSVLDDLSGVENRVVLTSSDTDSLAWTAESWNFSKKLFHGIRLNQSVWDAFQATEEMILGNSKIFKDQRPQLDDTQDGFYSSADGPRSSRIFIGEEVLSQAEPPIITRIHDVIEIPANQSITTLWIKTSPSNEGIKKVTATLIKPSFELSVYDGENTKVIETTEIELIYNAAQDRYEAVYDNFRDAGLWKIMYEVEGTEGDLSDVKFGEVKAPGVSTPVLLDTWTNQSVYTYGDEFSLGVDINSQIECDLYALMIYPDGVTFQTIYYPGHFSMNFEVLPYMEDIEASSNRSISMLNKTISQGFSPGLYIFGVIATEPNVDVTLADQWIHLAYDIFEVK